ncbi:response regulator transcription factor [Xanthomonas theicola]|uniref:response regulator transcription factor n=1 Tax=Xanthomonas theicola TaxID=56464 RepID=UPI001FE9B05F|nr:response regulator transcription factor [Xanthomonas theicola]
MLFVEDNQGLLASVFAYLEARGFVLDAAPDGPSGLQLAAQGDYDVIVLDWMLPRMDGIEVLRHLRNHGSDASILLLTARDQLDSKLAGFRAGADDYLAKPFAMAELEARLLALSFRRFGRKQVLQVSDLHFDLLTQTITRGERLLRLYSGCRAVLEVLMRESPNVVSRERLEFAIWGDDRPDRDMLRSHMYELRKRLDLDEEPKLLHTINKQGYRLALTDAAEDGKA